MSQCRSCQARGKNQVRYISGKSVFRKTYGTSSFMPLAVSSWGFSGFSPIDSFSRETESTPIVATGSNVSENSFADTRQDVLRESVFGQSSHSHFATSRSRLIQVAEPFLFPERESFASRMKGLAMCGEDPFHAFFGYVLQMSDLRRHRSVARELPIVLQFGNDCKRLNRSLFIEVWNGSAVHKHASGAEPSRRP